MAMLSNAVGTLDADGRTSASFQLSSSAFAPLVGRTLHHAVLVLARDASPLIATNAVAVEILP